MNKIKNLHIVNLLLEISAIALLFFNGLYLLCLGNHDKYEKNFFSMRSMSYFSEMNINNFWCNMFLATIIVMIVIFIVQITSKKFSILSFLVSLLQCTSFLLFNNQVFNGSTLGAFGERVTFIQGPIYYFYLIILISIIATSLFSFIYNKKYAKNFDSAYNKDSMKSCETDELKKFKDLLDSGIITQEEFDEKKKQLLGL